MAKKQFRTICILFSIYFFIYAASPLLYSYEPRNVSGLTNSSVINLQLLVVDLVLSNLSRDMGQDNHHSINLLFRQKQAILSSPDSLNTENKPITSLDKIRDITAPPTTSIYILAAYDNGSNFHEDFHKFHSGLSPPSAYL
ncbi:MAG: hypothetical protein HY266_09405 [Deltaproteobacteria bacterium]|nr:hypothetical protein [Deltaproteobacteria bacterium]